MANLARLTAEAAVYPTAEVYRTDPAIGRGIGASVTPATVADRIDAVRDYINRLDFMTRKQKLTLPPSWARHPRTPERAHAAEAKYKKWLLLQRKHEDVALSPARPAASSISSGISTSSTPKPYPRHRADFRPVSAPSAGFRVNGKRRTTIHKAAVPRRRRRGVSDGPIRRAYRN